MVGAVISTALLWLAVATFGPLIPMGIYYFVREQRRRRNEAAETRRFMEERRARFGGGVRPPGSDKVIPVDRPGK